MRIKSALKKILKGTAYSMQMKEYQERFDRYAFVDCQCETKEQFEASIIRLYHTIEKGLSFKEYRAGFGKDNIEKLVTSLEQYCMKGFDPSSFAYETALSCLNAYIKKNKEHGHIDSPLEERIGKLPGKANDLGGTIAVSAPKNNENMDYARLVSSRHSIRFFSDKPVDLESVKEAIRLAQNTPSACNRQGWRTIIVEDRKKMEAVLSNQNGNRGFGQTFDKLLVITSDLRSQQKSREAYQAFIDGGMYAESVLNALWYKGIGSCPLSASLSPEQDKNVRSILGIHDAEILVLFVGIGNYPEGEILTTRSARKNASIEII